ncbi:recombinase family protein [Vibrio harveyi]|uniref:recombinase family protein n=1 Tax=Vibrio harveyi TaxID=669 RepID=UPI0031BBB952
METTTRRRAVTYQRFSSVRQLGNSSLERQKEETKNWLARNPDVEVIDSFVDKAMSGWSGKHLEEGSLGKLMKAIDDGIITSGTLILVEHFSRLSRQNIRDAEHLMHRIWDAGITVVTVRDGTEYSPDAANDMALRIRLIVEMEQAYKESEWRSAKVKASYVNREKKAKEGIVPKMRKPFWLNPDGTLNELHEAIKDMFELYKNGKGQRLIMDALREKYADTAIQKMNPTTVMRWIQADITRGYWRGNRIYEAAIDDETFFEVQAIHKNRLYKNVKPDRNWPLSGLMKCGTCGRGMSIQQTSTSNPVVRCSGKQRDRSCERKTTFPYFLVHQYMMTIVKKHALRKYSNVNSNKELRHELRKIENELISARSSLSELREFYKSQKSQGKKGFATLELIEEEHENIESLESRENEIKASLDELAGGGISREARTLVLDAYNFNLEMHKLNFRIVVGDYELSAEGFDEELPTLKFIGYSRKTKCYEWTQGSHRMVQSWPSADIVIDALMLKGYEENIYAKNFFEKQLARHEN